MTKALSAEKAFDEALERYVDFKDAGLAAGLLQLCKAVDKSPKSLGDNALHHVRRVIGEAAADKLIVNGATYAAAAPLVSARLKQDWPS